MIVAQLATEVKRLKVNEDIRHQHYMHGWESTPVFEEDHRDGKYPTYYRPRSLLYGDPENNPSRPVG
jgi:hypothetical protein